MTIAAAGELDDALAALAAGVAAAASLDTGPLDETQLRRLLGTVHDSQRQLAALRTRLATEVADRQAARARAERPDDRRAGSRARRESQRQLAEDLTITPGEAKRELATGRRLKQLSGAAALYAQGKIGDRHVRELHRTLAHFTGAPRRALQAELLAAAPGLDAVAFGRLCRTRLAELDHAAAMADLDRAYARRRASLTQTPAGTTVVSGEGPGLDAEILHTAVGAFRRPDARDERRNPEQRTWDALIAMAQAALDAGTAPTVRGARPHVLIRLNDQTLREQVGVGTAGHTGPLPYGELVRVLGDAQLAGVLCDSRWLPLRSPDRPAISRPAWPRP